MLYRKLKKVEEEIDELKKEKKGNRGEKKIFVKK